MSTVHKLLPFGGHPSECLITASVTTTPEGLVLNFTLKGPMVHLHVPKLYESAPSFRDGLWQSTCFEFFCRWQGQDNYQEWNFSPSGDWAFYRFASYRQVSGQERLSPQQPIACQQNSATDFELRVAIPWPAGASTNRQLNYGLSAVLHFTDDRKEYWALAHTGERPDFHAAGSFTGQLAFDL